MITKKSICINLDCGELNEAESPFFDIENIAPYINMANVSCGAHSGDAEYIMLTLEVVSRFEVEIGYHPSYPDKLNFGRKAMNITTDELYNSLLSQLKFLYSLAKKIGLNLTYVKPHGALYNMAHSNTNIASVILAAMKDANLQIKKIMCQPGSMLAALSSINNIDIIYECFGDRTYNDDGSLTARSNKDAIITSLPSILERYHEASEGYITTRGGQKIYHHYHTICYHGDHPQLLSNLHVANQIG